MIVIFLVQMVFFQRMRKRGPDAVVRLVPQGSGDNWLSCSDVTLLMIEQSLMSNL